MKRILVLVIFCFITIGATIVGGEEMSSEINCKENKFTDKTARIFLKQMFSDLFDKNNSPRLTAKKYVTQDYIQLVDGEVLKFNEFVEHLEVLHKEVVSVEVTFKQVIASGSTISDIHIVDAVKKDGSKLQAKVIAFYSIRGDKVSKVEELTFLLDGAKEDKDLGSRTN